MNPSTTQTMFSSASDEWSTPDDFLNKLALEFGFTIDAAALPEKAKFPRYCYPPGRGDYAILWPGEGIPNGLAYSFQNETVWLNPPYSELRAWISWAAFTCQNFNATWVTLIPSRTDTRAFHDYIWDESKNSPRPGVEIRFVKGRLKFGGSRTPAPFPSMVVIFRPPVNND